MRTSILALAAVSLVVCGCGGRKGTGTRPDSRIGSDPVSHVEVAISGLSHQDALVFQKELEQKGEIKNMVIKSETGGTVVFELDVEGCECELPAKIAQIPYPGFTYKGRFSSMRYQAFDNKPPTLTFVHPEADNKVLNELEPIITVEVPDADVATVSVNGVTAERYKGNVFRAKIRLKEGVNDVVAVAKDKSGNETKQLVHVGIDTTAPTLQAQVRIIVEGDVEPGASVLVDGQEVPVDAKGHYRAEVPIKKGQKVVHIVAIDTHGNKTVTERSLTE